MLKKKGIYFTTVPSIAIILQMLWTSLVGNKKVMFATTKHSKKNLVFLKECIEGRKLKSVIDKHYPLEQIAETHSYVEEGHKKGDISITFGFYNGV